MFSYRNARPVITFVSLLLLPVGFLHADHRKPLKKPETSLPRTAEPQDLADGGRVRYYPEKKVYLFTNEGENGRKYEVYFELSEADVVVLGSAYRGSDGIELVYQYILENLPTTRQNIRYFEVRTPVPVSNPNKPDDGWVVFLYPTKHLPERTDISWADIRPRTSSTPPPMPYVAKSQETEEAIQEGWEPRGIWSRAGVPPGRTQGGFSFESSYLPGILECTAKSGNFITVTYGWIPPLIDEEGKRFLQGKTVGPAIAPDEPPLEILERLEGWIPEALELGWLHNKPQASQLVWMIGNIKSALRQQKRGEAKAAIESTLDTVSDSRTMTPEIVSILMINLQHILQSISAPLPSSQRQ